MKFFARCLYCRCRFKAPEAMLGAIVECPRCKTTCSLLPEDAAPKVEPAAAPRAETTPVAAAVAVAPKFPPPGAATDGLTAGHVALFLAGAALLCSFLPVGLVPIILVGGVGLLVGGAGLWLGDRPLSIGLHTCGPLASAAALVFAGLLPLSSRAPALDLPAAAAPNYVRFRFAGGQPREGKLDPVAPRDGVWANAEGQAVRLNGVVVAVGSVAVESLPLRVGGRAVTSDPCLVVRLQLLCEATDRPVSFGGWYDGQGQKAGVSLIDPSRGLTFQPRRFQPGTDLVSRKLDLVPGGFADELLVYQAPRERASVLRLQLPASAFGGAGVLRFQIPASMIRGFTGGRY